MKEAIILHRGSLSKCEYAVIEMLKFFGIPWSCMKLYRGITAGEWVHIPDRNLYCVLASAATIAETVFLQEDSGPAFPEFLSSADSVYVFGFEQTENIRNLLQFLTDDPHADIVSIRTSPIGVSVADDVPELCGPMSGIGVEVAPEEGDLAFKVSNGSAKLQRIVITENGDLFIGTTCQGTQFYLNGCHTIQDIHAHIGGRYFDIKDYFLSAVPTTIFLKWAFSDVCWTSPEIGACLIIDDPLIKDRYGFLRYCDLIDLMDRHDFSTNIAFIPWNWRRTHKGTVNLFRTRPDKLSIAIHGCDHTGGEFAETSVPVLNARAKLAIHRMEGMHQRTELDYERIMVFPQGAFSVESAHVLKLNNYIAAVNTEYAPAGEDPSNIKIATAWGVAITQYGGYPLFTRRYMFHGIENFAFDSLVGKPCLIVAHHEVFGDTGSELVSFINRLNALTVDLHWRGLGDLVRHSYQLRSLNCGAFAVNIFGSRASIANPSTHSVRFLAEKRESEPDCVQNVLVDGIPVKWDCSDGILTFAFELQSREVADLCIVYADKLGLASSGPGVQYRIKARMRRYLSELRDNYLSRSKSGYRVLVQLNKLLTERKQN